MLIMLVFTGKLLVIAVVEEYKLIGKLASEKHVEFKERLEKIANTYLDTTKFIFGWTSHTDLINSIAIQTLDPLPNFIVINSTNLKYFLVDELVPQNIINLLNDLESDHVTAKVK